MVNSLMKKDLRYFKNQLLKEKNRMKNIIKSMEKNGASQQDMFSSTELSNYDNHPADLATEVFQVEMNNGLKVHQEGMLQDIDKALDKIENGDYGICELCGKMIGQERLKVLPFARLCIDCEENEIEDIEVTRQKRPVEEDVLGAPFGRKYLNRRMDGEYEGLEYLNDVMKYGSSDTPQDMDGYNDYIDFYSNDIDNQGIVDKMDAVSNEQYKRQLPD